MEINTDEYDQEFIILLAGMNNPINFIIIYQKKSRHI